MHSRFEEEGIICLGAKEQLDIWKIAFASLIIIILLQPLSLWLQGFVSWHIINPASNHTGWYVASLKEWSLSWIWPSAWLALWALRGNAIRSWIFLTLLALVALGIPETSLWEVAAFTDEERWVIGITDWYKAGFKYSILAAMTVTAVRKPLLLIPAYLLSGLWIFI